MPADPLRGLPLAIAAGAVLLLAAGGAGTSDGMPKGGRALLLEVTGSAPAQWTEVIRQQRSEDEWRQWAAQAPGARALGRKQQATLAAYLALNTPMAASHAAALPRDGRDLAWGRCQSCHSLAAGPLAQQGPGTPWRELFDAPFHSHLRMSPREREELARYAEINLPLQGEVLE